MSFAFSLPFLRRSMSSRMA
uniref:Uncharacterized protein n=1 Tax=Arundo donax TaxID=35708 RepID=A0A0A9BHP6_ARUDO